MPAIQRLTRAAYASPARFLIPRNGSSDHDNKNGGVRIISGGIIAVIIVCVLVLLSVGDNSGNGNKTGLDPTKYIKKAIKKCMKKIKKMVSRKNKKTKAGATANQDQETLYGQGTHPGYGQNERSMGYSGGYDRLDDDNEERVALSSAPYGARNDQ
ncbi:hypothetical protein CORC01_05321 [Colletotrichum orchidophilum]|uniref:Uncharacterized protein n=1 Tax=Colletotrichum orchidophilum TaxID=1209926 RepID=A0A1G4BD32_9PEZI|nr:uncharacterized protein CORC01_05321 [Colletotrichum orchidophilum]OHE99280.1 hypothetical protein CORC01_05321 [Colletotrichum orchidophilum]